MAICGAVRLSKADIVLTTYNIVSREVGVPEGLKKDKHAHDMPAMDGALEEPAPPGGGALDSTPAASQASLV